MENETFDIMWQMSSPGGAAEGCIMRTPILMYSHQPTEEATRWESLHWMPEVSAFFSGYQLLVLLTSGISLNTFPKRS
jgi:hypothetical protein